MSEIVCITFKTHQTIIGEVTEQGDDIVVKNPMQVIAVPPRAANDPGGVGLHHILLMLKSLTKASNSSMMIF